MTVFLLLIMGCTTAITIFPYIDEHKTKEEVLALFLKSTAPRGRYFLLTSDKKDLSNIKYFIKENGQYQSQDLAGLDMLVHTIKHETPLKIERTMIPEWADFTIEVVSLPDEEQSKSRCTEKKTYDTRNGLPTIGENRSDFLTEVWW